MDNNIYQQEKGTISFSINAKDQVENAREKLVNN
jgi:hypothetical protein